MQPAMQSTMHSSMQSSMYSAVQPLSSYNPFSISNGSAPQAIKPNASAQVDAVSDISAIKAQSKTNAAVNNVNQNDGQLVPDNEQVLYFDESAIKSAVDAKVQYDQQTSSHAHQHHSQGSEGAIKEYLLNQHAAQRDQIQQMVGIDLYA
ncbi:hypothetical protein Q4601_03365 [Shewanella sp. 1_MG-2023]|uniref:hypothetical protein n=1 Tax=unclassified Shewanella TaxID=196818 RepID=UPI000C832B22|nr:MULTISPECIES: hypothetical protein [unclassified Shewanella]MCC4832906.1 hypothetical protein [Shewanella sp. 10N.7]MDO6610958.1 hypothetical protein [Shewanella sp. 7_MG-2023]MDO6770191.1 hypothetical protein [Shewanella sp. 2_MG-2023]MDO6793332.1 hypothetical protein [Shewanella sp. 1_MG-2023]PMG80466.1 hypothetical protein BCU84_03775 [Shewanella sp. 10N.286.51.B7]